jgi:benzoyl-CoA reductase/2-hydroxyglutaryl-CoA dehydratase subunit BcrC/BadD/HgdB
MTPYTGRFELIGRLIENLNIQGVVNLTWQFCHTYNVEAHRVRELVEGKYGLPMLHVETDYSESDTGQLKTRIEAFLEMMK